MLVTTLIAKEATVIIKRVCLLGAESTGKTTLAKALAEHYDTEWVPEYARSFLEKKRGTRVFDFMVPIALGQYKSEEETIKRANLVLFCDTCLLSTSIWSDRYFGKCDDLITQMVNRERYDLYLLLDIDLPWVNDGLRDSEHYREWMHKRFISELIKRELPYMVLSGTPEERMMTAIKAVDNLIRL